MNSHRDPHQGEPVLHAGVAVANARLVAILLHGGGGSAADILGLSREFGAPNVAYLAPQASGHTWYPYSFLPPLDQNEAALGSAMRMIAGLIVDLGEQGPCRKIALHRSGSHRVRASPWSSLRDMRGALPPSAR